MQIGKKSIRLNPRLWIRMNPDQFFNPNESEIGIIRIGRLGLNRIEFWLELKISD